MLFKKDLLLNSIANFQKILITIIHGRYDIVYRLSVAFEVARQLPEASFHIIPDAGHSATEPGTQLALLEATERMKQYC